MKNVLETVSIRKYPEIQLIKNKLDGLGALGTLMSGSGPSVVGVFTHRDQACIAWEIIKDEYRESYLVSSYNRGD
jgi:4-diphosphocytidyl-2-C-methyl-D-erythritol kinase